MTGAARFIPLAQWPAPGAPETLPVPAGVREDSIGVSAPSGPSRRTDRILLGDALAVAQELPAGRAQLVYLDPPFFTGTVRRGRARGSGRRPAFEDRWSGGLGAYLDWVAGLLEAALRLLEPSGSLFLHLDHRAVHGAKLVADSIFGSRRLVNEIVWFYGSGGRARRHFPRKHDTILWYARGVRPAFYPDAVGVDRRVCPLCGQRRGQWNHLRRQVDRDGRVYRTIRSAGKEYRYYDAEPVLPSDVWLDLSHLQQKDPERTGWPTQKPERLLTRILEAVTRPGDLVVDLVAGSGTTLAAARRLGRACVGVDASPEAIALAWDRLTRPARSPTQRSQEAGDGDPAPSSRAGPARAVPLRLELFGGVGSASAETGSVETAPSSRTPGLERRPVAARAAGIPGAPESCWIQVVPPEAGRAAALVALLLSDERRRGR